MHALTEEHILRAADAIDDDAELRRTLAQVAHALATRAKDYAPLDYRGGSSFGDDDCDTVHALLAIAGACAIMASSTPFGQTSSLRPLVESRVAIDPMLTPYRETVLADWPTPDAHLRWALWAPVAEIVNWAHVAQDEAD